MHFSIFATYLWLVLHKKPIFRTRKMENDIFVKINNVVRCHNMHVCVEYGHILANYAMDVAITPVIWPERQESS